MSKEEVEEKNKNNKEEDSVFTVNLTTLVIIIVILIAIIAVFFYLYTNRASDALDELKTQAQESIVFKEIDENKAVELLKSYLSVKSKVVSNPQSVLETYGFATNQQFEAYDKIEEDTFYRTDILYDNVRRKFENYLTKDFFNREYKDIYKESNGITYVSTKTQPEETYEITRQEVENNTATRYSLKVWYKTTVDGTESAEKNMEVNYVLNNDRWVISDIK